MSGPFEHIMAQCATLKPSATLAINERSKQLQAEGRSVVRFGLGQSPFPVPDCVVQALRENAHQKDYLAVQGLPQLREAVAAYHTRETGNDYTADNVMIGPGSKELLFLVQMLYEPDELLLSRPSWVSYAPQSDILSKPAHTEAHSVRFIKSGSDENGWRLQATDLDKACTENGERRRLLILNYPNNPAGTTYTADQLRDIAAVCRKHRILVIADEIYSELHFTGSQTSIAKFYPEGSIITAGLSKWCGAGGWRLGTLCLPSSLSYLMRALCGVASETFTSVSAPIQFAAVRAFAGSPEIDDYLRRSRIVLKVIGSFVARELRSVHVACSDPEGGFYVFVTVPPLRDESMTSAQMCESILNDAGVAMLPGSCFGVESELTFRLAFVDFDGAEALASADSAVTDEMLWLRTHCPRVVQGMSSLCDWITANAKK